ncbi:MAG TPA: ribosome maturation factor RimP [Elusimicrobia bacterium]|nr:ribosome maturation factor RimP [Elusimicrobiota bacterium]
MSHFLFLGMTMSIIKQIEELINPTLESSQLELVDLSYTKESGKMVLRLFLDKEGGIKLSDCEEMSSKLGDILDNCGFLPQDYVLEVSSPGIDRVIKKEKDFVRFNGRKVKINTFAPVSGQRNFIGKLVSYGSNKVVIEDAAKNIIEIELSNISRARLEPELG